MSSRLQFSLSSLLLLTVAMGALTGFFIIRHENVKLRAENSVYREELGILEIGDRSKSWARAKRPDFSGIQRFRIYVPGAGNYRIGFQTQEIIHGVIDRSRAKYRSFHMKSSGEALCEMRLLPSDAGDGTLTLKVTPINSGYDQLTTTINWGKPGFDTTTYTNDSTLGVTTESSTFDPAKPLILVSIKANIVTGSAGNSRTSKATTEIGPGLLLWFEREPEKP